MSSRDYTIRKEFPLTNEQNEIVEFMLQRNKCINAAQTGLGKTYCSLTAVVYLLLKYPDTHTIILAPQKAVKAFKRELEGKLRISYNILTSHEEKINENARITIITYTSLHKFLPYIDGLHKTKRLILMCDEAHILGDSNNKVYGMVASIRHYFNVFYMLTATPLKNDISGLFWLFNMLDPNIFKDWNTFKQSFCVVERRKIMRAVGKGTNKRKSSAMIEEIVGYKNLDVLKNILDKYVILKQKKYNLEFLYHSIELDGHLVEPYLEAGKGLLRESSKDSFGVRLHDIQSVVDNINPYYKTTSMTNKEQMLLKLVAFKMKNNQPTIIYCDYNDVIDRLEYLLNYSNKITGVQQILKVTGDVTQKKREKVEEQINDKTVVLITSAGTESINLQKANSIIFYDLPYSIVALIQCFTVDSYILTDMGYQMIKNLDTEFNVIVNNKKYKARKLITENSNNLYRVTFNNGRVLKVTDNHKFKVLTESGCVWKEIKDITENDDVVVQFNTVGSDIKSNIKSEIWYIIGHLIGDGFISDRIRKGNRETLVQHIFGNDNKSLEVFERVKECYDKLNWHYTIRTVIPNRNGKVYNPIHFLNCYNRKVADLLLNLGYPNVKGPNKFIPSKIFTESLENKKSFILGLFDSDGNKTNIVGWNMSSYKLVYELQLLLASCGVRSNLYITKTQNNSFRLNIPGAYCRDDIFNITRGVKNAPILELNKILNLVHFKKSCRSELGLTDYIKRLKIGKGKNSKYEKIFRDYFLVPENIKQEDLYNYYKTVWSNKPNNINNALYYFSKGIGSMELLERVKKHFNLNYKSEYYDTVNVVNKEPIDNELICKIEVLSDEHCYVGDLFPSHNCIGRVTRMDSKYDKQYIHFIETIGTIDSYKKYLIQNNIGLINMVFGQMETLPLDLNNKDRAFISQVKDALLWCFKQGRLLTKDELNKIIK